jgi:hypothetical protein
MIKNLKQRFLHAAKLRKTLFFRGKPPLKKEEEEVKPKASGGPV